MSTLLYLQKLDISKKFQIVGLAFGCNHSPCTDLLSNFAIYQYEDLLLIRTYVSIIFAIFIGIFFWYVVHNFNVSRRKIQTIKNPLYTLPKIKAQMVKLKHRAKKG